MSLWWSLAPLIIVAGLGGLAAILRALTFELEELRHSLVQLERVGVGVDEAVHDIAALRAEARQLRGLDHDSSAQFDTLNP